MIVYRKMRADDIDGVYKVEVSAFDHPWTLSSLKSEQKNKLSKYFVAENEDKSIVGYIGAWYIIDEAHITNVAVHKDFRGLGIGEGLVSTLVDNCKDESISAITLEVRSGNSVAQNLYKKFGFLPGGIRKEYYADNKEDAIIMWKQLKEMI